MSKKIEKAINLLAVLKENLQNLQEKGIDTTMIVTIEKSIKELVKIENEIVSLSTKLEGKIILKKQKKDDLSQLIKSTNNILAIKGSAKKKSKADKKIKIEQV